MLCHIVNIVKNWKKQVNEAFNYTVYEGFSDTVVRTEKSASSGKDNDDDEIKTIYSFTC